MFINASPNVTKNEYANLYDNFLSSKGYMTKLINKKYNSVEGYLVRCELETINDIVFVGIMFQPVTPNFSQRFIKSLAINRVQIAGKRKLKQLLKTIKAEDIKSESILNQFKHPDSLSELELNLFRDEFNTNTYEYRDFYEYIKMFENKIKKYYNNKTVKIITV